MDSVNRTWYSRPEAVASFAGDDLLEPALALLLVRYREWIVERDVLDIGVGAGRTTRYLAALTTRYVGIDYSSSMVGHCAARYPGVRIELGDARDLSRFATGSFDFTLFSYAGLDALGPDDRGGAIHEVRRVVRPGGIFAFSTHNRDFADAHLGPQPRWSRNPVTLVANVGRWARDVRNHRRLMTLERETSEFALINDVAEHFSLIHYYITASAQRAQLEQAGFEVISVTDDQGAEVPQGAVATRAPWLWYVARRPA